MRDEKRPVTPERPSSPHARRVLCIQNMAGEGFGRFERHLRAAGHHVGVVRACDGEALPPIDSCDLVIVAGTPLAAYRWEEHAFLRDEAAFLRQAVAASTPCLGVCFGAQFLALLLGGRAYRADRKEIGGYDVFLTEAGRRDPLLAGFPPRFPVFHWHGDTFDPPPGAALLARGDGVRHQAFRLGAVIGVQFHLEVTVEDAAAWTEVYGAELADVGKTAEQVVAECRAIDAEMDRLADRFLGNVVAVLAR
ncbi:MAG: type 1 glutamine amidotransferase [Gemmatimonadota bacterium]